MVTTSHQSTFPEGKAALSLSRKLLGGVGRSLNTTEKSQRLFVRGAVLHSHKHHHQITLVTQASYY